MCVCVITQSIGKFARVAFLAQVSLYSIFLLVVISFFRDRAYSDVCLGPVPPNTFIPAQSTALQALGGISYLYTCQDMVCSDSQQEFARFLMLFVCMRMSIDVVLSCVSFAGSTDPQARGDCGGYGVHRLLLRRHNHGCVRLPHVLH